MEETKKKILIIDNDINTCELLRIYLKGSNFNIKIVSNKKDIKEEFNEYNPSMVILDILYPNIKAIEFLKWIRLQSTIPIMVLTENNNTIDKVLTLEVGADDYIVKPFDPKELLARIKAVMRRYCISNEDKTVIKYKDIFIDLNSYKVMLNHEEIKMPPKEFELLYYLAKNKNKVFTREHLLFKVWGYDYVGDSRTVDVHIKRLRNKLKKSKNWDLETVWGVGYKFQLK